MATLSDQDRKYILFQLGHRKFAANIADIGEITYLESIQPLKHPQPCVNGLATHRGVSSPVLTLNTLFQLPSFAATGHQPAITLGNHHEAHLAVDDIFGLTQWNDSTNHPLSEKEKKQWHGFVTARHMENDEEILVMRLDHHFLDKVMKLKTPKCSDQMKAHAISLLG